MMKPSISVISPSLRPPGLKIVAQSLAKQTLKPNEWLICGPLINKKEVEKNIGDIFPYTYLGNRPLKPGMLWDLNYSYNKLIEKADGDLLISWQDWVWVATDGIQKFWDRYVETRGKALIATSGNQYARIGKYGKPEIKIWSDPRQRNDQGSFYEILPSDFEWNYGAVPKQALTDVGGFCNRLDQTGYGMDGYQVNERLNLLGWKFYIDHSNESFTVRHDRSDFGGEKNWNKNNNLHNGGYEKVKKELKESGNWPIIKIQ